MKKSAAIDQPNSHDLIYHDMVEQPLPPMTLRIGISGHRHLPADKLDLLRQKVSEVYSDIYATVTELAPNRDHDVNEISAKIYAPDSAPVIRIISPLAEGADRLCIDPELIKFNHELACILPFSKQRYAQDFIPGGSLKNTEKDTTEEYYELLNRIGYGNPDAGIIELDGDSQNATAAYNNCGRLLVEHSDILIAMYNGDNKPDVGSSAVVKEAIASGVPVIHISTIDGSVSIYPSKRFGVCSDRQTYEQDLLSTELKRILLFNDLFDPDSNNHNDDNSEIIQRFERYIGGKNLQLNDREPIDFSFSGPIGLRKSYKSPIANTFRLFKGLVASPKRIQKTMEKENLKKHISSTSEKPSPPQFGTSMHTFYAAYLRADRLAEYYANIHRSTFLLIYCFGAIALISSVLPLAYGLLGEYLVLSLVIKTFFLLAILYFYLQDHRNNYHGRWLEYRSLAEHLRPMYYLILLGKTHVTINGRNTNEYLTRNMMGHGNQGRHWFYIHLETLVRSAGFNHCRIDENHKQATRNMANHAWVQEQIKYHAHNTAAMQVLGSRLGSWCNFLFFATIVVVLLKLALVSIDVYFGIHLISDAMSHTIALATVVLPILATAFFAIRNHAEFDISAHRSRSMLAFLCSQQEKLLSSDQHGAVEQLTDQLHRIANRTIEEVSQWLEIYEAKEAEPS